MSDTTDDDLATLLARREHARPNRLTWILLVLLVLAVGFAGGAFVQKRAGSPSSTLPDFAAFRAGGGPPAGGGLFPGGAAVTDGGAATAALGITSGTVKLVDGNNLYITDADGNTVKVIVPDSAAVTSQVETDLDGLTAGTTVLIRGDTAEDGTLTADSVTQSELPETTTQGDN